MNNRFVFLFLFCVLIMVFQNQSFAQTKTSKTLNLDEVLCPDSRLLGKRMISDVCWSGIYPIRLGGVKIAGRSKYAPKAHADKTFCKCDDNPLSLPGITMSMFLPTYLVTTTSRPYCFPELNGTILSENMGLVGRFAVGNQDLVDGGDEGVDNDSDYQFHFAAFPVMRILDMFKLGSCTGDGLSTFDYLWMSETLPWWTDGDSELTMTLMPESVILSNPLAMAAIITDCVASSVDEPIDRLFFSSGCHGSMYGLNGETSDPSKASSMSLVANRAFYFVSRIGQLKLTMGEDAICKPVKQPLWKRSGYRIQQMWPMPELDADPNQTCLGGAGPDCGDNSTAPAKTQNQVEVTNSVGFDPAVQITNQLDSYKIASLNEICTHPVGQTSFVWGEWRTASAGGSDHASYLYFQWKDCCIDRVGSK